MTTHVRLARALLTRLGYRIESPAQRSQRVECPKCNPTARAIEYVRHQWIAAGIDRE